VHFADNFKNENHIKLNQVAVAPSAKLQGNPTAFGFADVSWILQTLLLT